LWIECAWWWRRWRSRTWRARGAVEGGLFQLRAEASVASCHDERKGIALHFFDVCDEFHAIGEERLPHLGALLARRAFRRPGRHVVVFLFRPLRQATHLAHRYRRRGIDELTDGHVGHDGRAIGQRPHPAAACIRGAALDRDDVELGAWRLRREYGNDGERDDEQRDRAEHADPILRLDFDLCYQWKMIACEPLSNAGERCQALTGDFTG